MDVPGRKILRGNHRLYSAKRLVASALSVSVLTGVMTGILVYSGSLSSPAAAAASSSSSSSLSSPYTWSAPQSIDPGVVILSISCPTTSFCMGVDSEGNALTWNGSSWSSQDIDGTNNLVSVSCPSVFGCMAVDGDGNAFSAKGPPPPVVSLISPYNGPTSGGTVVSVEGLHLISQVTSIYFGANEASGVSCTGGSSCDATSPPGDAGYSYVTASTPWGTSVVNTRAAFSYLAPVPVPESIGDGGGGASTNLRQCSSGDPVNCATGDLYETATDLSVAGIGGGLQLTRTYNSLDASVSSPFGYGWSCSYCISLDVTTSGAIATLANGSTLSFSEDPSGTFSAPSYEYATLAANPSGGYDLVLRADTTFSFSSSGQLLSIASPNGVNTTLSYSASGTLSTVTNTSGRSLSFTSNSASEITSVTDPLGRTLDYTYDSNGNLTSVTEPDGKSWSFGYNSSHLLTSMTNPDGATTTYTYDAAGMRLTSTDPLGRTTTYSYDPDGQIAGVTEPSGWSLSYAYNAAGELCWKASVAVSSPSCSSPPTDPTT
ncbi:MAG: DUF6531 domain-containing protein, partial [Actinobacteria bacterium]|nr:DUF6531 domain-containing protein [Actinomycetota bacterium]